MIELNVNNLSKYYGAKKIFENISFEIQTGERLGLIGQNGCGKTTIMKILMGKEDYQSGEISLRKGNKVGYLDQIPVYEESTTTMDVLRLAFESIDRIKKQMDELLHQMEKLEGIELEKVMNSYSRLLEQYELAGGYELEVKINKITEGLQISDNLKEMEFEKLSGGEKTRVILAKILLEEPDILLLDEPTNHLDLATIEWLEGFLKDYKGAALIISHDRHFLDNVVTKIVELTADQAKVYLGNYSYYVLEKERRFLIDLKNYQNQQKKIDQMEGQIERYRIWGEMRDSDKMFRRAKELEKRLEKMEVMNRPILNNRKIRLTQSSAGRSGKIVLQALGLSKSFEDRVLIKDASLQLYYQDSACIIGKNGSGKTTLLKLLLGELEPEAGEIKIGAQVKIGYLPQHVSFMDEEQTVLEYFAGLYNISYGAARAQLAKVLFMNEDVNRKIKFLSGGEKSRLKLCSLTYEGVNFLILDEPTNHLDIDSREVLEETLEEFDGTLLFVSHDRYFINKLADKIIDINNCTAKEYPGDYSYYQEECKKEAERLMKAETETIDKGFKHQGKGKTETDHNGDGKAKSKASIKASVETSEKASGNPRKIRLLEEYIEGLEEKIKSLEMLMDEHSSDSLRLKELFDEKEDLRKELDKAYEEWEAVAD